MDALHPFRNTYKLFAVTIYLWVIHCKFAMAVPCLKCISKAVWSVIYPKGQTCLPKYLIETVYILLCFLKDSGYKEASHYWMKDKETISFGFDSLWYFWIIFKARTSQLKKGSPNKTVINVSHCSHCYRGTKGFKISETCWDICAQFLYTMQKVQNIMGNLILKGCQSRSMLWRVSYGSDQFIKKASELFYP